VDHPPDKFGSNIVTAVGKTAGFENSAIGFDRGDCFLTTRKSSTKLMAQ